MKNGDRVLFRYLWRIIRCTVEGATRRTTGKFRHGVVTPCPSNYGPLKRLGESAVDAFLQTFRQIRRSVAAHTGVTTLACEFSATAQSCSMLANSMGFLKRLCITDAKIL